MNLERSVFVRRVHRERWNRRDRERCLAELERTQIRELRSTQQRDDGHDHEDRDREANEAAKRIEDERRIHGSASTRCKHVASTESCSFERLRASGVGVSSPLQPIGCGARLSLCTTLHSHAARYGSGVATLESTLVAVAVMCPAHWPLQIHSPHWVLHASNQYEYLSTVAMVSVESRTSVNE